ncbi:OLC1v1019400C1 [Oldenlandia corymbosa var. corymbosa]|uniref:OLC1v1019400C1 n=1 Tax=Oldenlandia corymbosa var. corymbosa TaxID=529605 RepID=A0AAV1EE19_OLDCO|nr:OLC1v1019400C1 [Oldenlandia corymbosa var. corymbosa]
MSLPSVARICVKLDLLKEHSIRIRLGVEASSTQGLQQQKHQSKDKQPVEQDLHNSDLHNSALKTGEKPSETQILEENPPLPDVAPVNPVANPVVQVIPEVAQVTGIEPVNAEEDHPLEGCLAMVVAKVASKAASPAKSDQRVAISPAKAADQQVSRSITESSAASKGRESSPMASIAEHQPRASQTLAVHQIDATGGDPQASAATDAMEYFRL